MFCQRLWYPNHNSHQVSGSGRVWPLDRAYLFSDPNMDSLIWYHQLVTTKIKSTIVCWVSGNLKTRTHDYINSGELKTNIHLYLNDISQKKTWNHQGSTGPLSLRRRPRHRPRTWPRRRPPRLLRALRPRPGRRRVRRRRSCRRSRGSPGSLGLTIWQHVICVLDG